MNKVIVGQRVMNIRSRKISSVIKCSAMSSKQSEKSLFGYDMFENHMAKTLSKIYSPITDSLSNIENKLENIERHLQDIKTLDLKQQDEKIEE